MTAMQRLVWLGPRSAGKGPAWVLLRAARQLLLLPAGRAVRRRPRPQAPSPIPRCTFAPVDAGLALEAAQHLQHRPACWPRRGMRRMARAVSGAGAGGLGGLTRACPGACSCARICSRCGRPQAVTRRPRCLLPPGPSTHARLRALRRLSAHLAPRARSCPCARWRRARLLQRAGTGAPPPRPL
jgi:hypothetical protein